MQMAKWFLLAPLVIFIFVGTRVFFYTGYYKKVTVQDPTDYDFHMVYKNHSGAYHKINDVIQSVANTLEENRIKCETSFGQFHDDVKIIEQDRLKSDGGCLLNTKPNNLAEGLKYKYLPSQKYVVAIFDGAPSIGPMKVYPEVDDYIKQNGLKLNGAVIEAYRAIDAKSLTTTYYFPVE